MSTRIVKAAGLLLITGLFLVSCGPAQDTASGSGFHPAITETMTLEPTATITPEPSLVPSPEGLGDVPAGYSPLYDPGNQSWGYAEGSGADAFPIPSLTVDSAGAHFLLDGTSVDIPTADMHDRIMVGQEGALQIYNDARTGIDYAWDTENNVWIVASEVLQMDISSPDNLIPIQTFTDLENLARLERMVLPPFPENTYFPPLESVGVDYGPSSDEVDQDAEYSTDAPFGRLPDGVANPFRIVNHIVLEKDEAAGRRYDSFIYTMQVYNPDDESFSLIHYGGYVDNPYWSSGEGFQRFLRGVRDRSGTPDTHGIIWYPLPRYGGVSRDDLNMWNSMGLFAVFDPVYQRYEFGESYYIWPEIKVLTEQWLTTGHVPVELERIVVSGELNRWAFPEKQP